MNHKSRIAKLEKRADETPAGTPRVIEIHKAYEDGHTEIETREVKLASTEAEQAIKGLNHEQS